MALYLNLYHEIQKQKLKRQRDPFKLAIMAVLLVFIGFIGYYFWRSEQVSKARKDFLALQSDWKTLEPQQATALADKTAAEENINLSTSIIHKAENRFYWAPLLQQIIQTVPAEVQLTGLDGVVTNDGAKKITITVNGIATGTQPRAAAEELRISLQNNLAGQYHQVTSIFRSLEDGAEPVQYEGKASPTAIFVIDLTFSSPDVNEKTPATPPAKP